MGTNSTSSRLEPLVGIEALGEYLEVPDSDEVPTAGEGPCLGRARRSAPSAIYHVTASRGRARRSPAFATMHGQLRRVHATAATPKAAERKLKVLLVERAEQNVGRGELTACRLPPAAAPNPVGKFQRRPCGHFVTVPHSVLVVDDRAEIREVLAYLLEADDRLRLAGTARDGVEALEHSSRACPDAIILDVQMPRMSGLEALPMLRSTCPASVIVMYSSDPEAVKVAPRAGADAWVDKAEDPVALIDLIVDLCRIA